jgi:hypothetical protein
MSFCVKISGRRGSQPPESPDSTSESQVIRSEEAVGFSAGNPRVEHVTGTVHLFRQVVLNGSRVPAGLPVSTIHFRGKADTLLLPRT